MLTEFRIFQNDTLSIYTICNIRDIPIYKNRIATILIPMNRNDKRLVAQFHISVAIILIFIFYHANLTHTLVF